MTSHRAEKPSASRRTVPSPAPTVPASTAGKRRSVRSAKVARSTSPHTGGRKKLIPGLPSAPSLVGLAALAVAAVGATVSQQASTPTSSDFAKFASQASVLNGASSVGSSDALSGRQRAVSRDSQREALQKEADAELLAAAESQAKERNAALAALAQSAEQHADDLAKNLWQLPVPAGSYDLTSRFGECSSLWSNCHTGLDFAAPSGTPISAVAAGVVTEVGYDGSYGNKTIVTLPDGTELWYCHQTSYTVSVGQEVAAGEQIGSVGSTGNTTGPHLHLEVHPGAGDAVDPMGAATVRGLSF